jgi:hypothetical protein
VLTDLTVILDDATSEISYAQMVEEESTRTVMRGLWEVSEDKGLFCSLYSDRGSDFLRDSRSRRKVDKNRLTRWSPQQQKWPDLAGPLLQSRWSPQCPVLESAPGLPLDDGLVCRRRFRLPARSRLRFLDGLRLLLQSGAGTSLSGPARGSAFAFLRSRHCPLAELTAPLFSMPAFNLLRVRFPQTSGRFSTTLFATNPSTIEHSIMAGFEVTTNGRIWVTAEGTALVEAQEAKTLAFSLTPTSSSWINQVERFVALITGRMSRRATFHTVHELQQAICKWLVSWNGEPVPFVWKALLMSSLTRSAL